MRLARPDYIRIVSFAVLVVVAVTVAVAAIRGWSFRGLGAIALPAPTGRLAANRCADRPVQAPRQLRGMWLTTVNNIDFPSRAGLDQATVQAEYRTWLDLAQRLNFNAIFVHVRPSGDAWWPSQYVPWSNSLTGSLDGRDPGWDPMAFMVAEAHARNLEFHAWFNPYKGAPVGDAAKLPATHPLRVHPQWAVGYPVGVSGTRLYYDPGIPEARRYVEDSILEAVRLYDLDGVHFDDFFYPYPGTSKRDFPDDASFATYGGGASRADWRRDNVNTFVREMSERIKALKPWVKFGISPFGIWRNQRTDPAGSPTRGLQSYDAIYADTRLWVQREWVDYIAPQLYWYMGFDIADYTKLVPWWSKLVTGTRVQLYIGQADYRVGQSGPWRDPAELERQLAYNLRYPVSGSIHFNATSVRADKLGAVSRYQKSQYAAPALIPSMAQLPAEVPGVPAISEVRRDKDGSITVRWRPGAGEKPVSYAVYRAERGSDAPATLVATVRTTGGQGVATQAAVDRTAAPDRRYAYCVSALDRSWHEGILSPAADLE